MGSWGRRGPGRGGGRPASGWGRRFSLAEGKGQDGAAAQARLHRHGWEAPHRVDANAMLVCSILTCPIRLAVKLTLTRKCSPPRPSAHAPCSSE